MTIEEARALKIGDVIYVGIELHAREGNSCGLVNPDAAFCVRSQRLGHMCYSWDCARFFTVAPVFFPKTYWAGYDMLECIA